MAAGTDVSRDGAEVMIWIMSVASELGHLLILGDKEARGRVGRPCRGCGRVYRLCQQSTGAAAPGGLL